MESGGVDMVVLSDGEAARNPSIRYYCGHPQDAQLFIGANGKTLLTPWDEHLAARCAQADEIIPYTNFRLDPVEACVQAAHYFGLKAGGVIEIPAQTTHLKYLLYVEKLFGFSVRCGGADAFIKKRRAIKDAGEIAILKDAAVITDRIINAVEKGVIDGSIKTEADAALFIEAESRAAGCEGASFDTLAAGGGRSFGIHAFPPYTAGPFADKGLSILDFGVRFKGYATDVTMTFARGPLSKGPADQIALVKEAFSLVIALLNKEIPIPDRFLLEEGVLSSRGAALFAEEFFKKHERFMPHGLGHGIGLEVHEEPFLSARAEKESPLAPGMTFTVEPGLYSNEDGGCRYENDVLFTQNGAEILTHSKIVYL
jgi:Xaa-Pro dipeptidase